MLQAFIFDLDGTIIDTEKLKAQSYGSAIDELTKGKISVQDVQKDFVNYVGSSRKTVLSKLVNDYYEALKSATHESDKQKLSSMILQKRLVIYNRLIIDPTVIRQNVFRDIYETIRKLHQAKKPLALATMSENYHTYKILQVTRLNGIFDVVLTSNDVENGKPDPEIYLKAGEKLNVSPDTCLVFEDSLNGIEAALHAGMQVIGIPNKLTEKQVLESNLLDKEHLVINHKGLMEKVNHLTGYQL